MQIDEGPSVEEIEHRILTRAEVNPPRDLFGWCQIIHNIVNEDPDRTFVPIALVEHAKSTLDVRGKPGSGMEGEQRVKKGGVMEEARFEGNRLMQRGCNDNEIIAAVKNNPPGHTGFDPHLAELGIQESLRLRPFFASFQEQGLITHPYTSLHRRPKETAFIAGLAGGERGINDIFHFDERITPAFHCLTKAEIAERFPEVALQLKNGEEVKHEGVEPMDWFTYRVLQGVMMVLYENAWSLNKTPIVPIVTHQTVIKVIVATLLGPDVSPFSFDIDNTSISLVLVKPRVKTEEEKALEKELAIWKPLFPNQKLADDRVFTHHFLDGLTRRLTGFSPEGVVVNVNQVGNLLTE